MRVSFVPLLAAAVLLFSGCRDAKVETYRVPSEKPEPLPPVLTGAGTASPSTPERSPAGADMAGTAVPTATGESLTWTAPKSWTPKPTSAMRKGSYAIAGDGGAEADCSVTAFPGDVGGELANINRWRNQLGLSPIAESALAESITRLEQDGLEIAVVEFANDRAASPQRMIGAIVPFGGSTWFFKLTGPDALVARERPAFLELLRSVKVPAPATR